ncbi:Hypothetical protein FKW44_005110 [Caligus rogercresseyi]|uniref:Uncharacterized protein n=1 Tax=Caligus rogercresseyi TaxID=217165 RepID=A0A7T8KBH6_CALRO|nr:Hypothetical protein FKW44_005110 [Caligus rogercresseyi]
MAFEGFLTRIFTIGEGLKPQHPIVTAGGTRGPKGHKMVFEGFLTRIFTIGERFETPTPHCYGWRDPRTQGAQNGI